MGIFENFPYSNIHNLNLDVVLEALKKIEDDVAIADQVNTSATEALTASQNALSAAADINNNINSALTAATTATDAASTATSAASSASDDADRAEAAAATVAYDVPELTAVFNSQSITGGGVFRFGRLIVSCVDMTIPYLLVPSTDEIVSMNIGYYPAAEMIVPAWLYTDDDPAGSFHLARLGTDGIIRASDFTVSSGNRVSMMVIYGITE